MTMPTLFAPVVGGTSYPYTYRNECESKSIVLSNRMANTSVQALKSWIDPEFKRVNDRFAKALEVMGKEYGNVPEEEVEKDVGEAVSAVRKGRIAYGS